MVELFKHWFLKSPIIILHPCSLEHWNKICIFSLHYIISLPIGSSVWIFYRIFCEWNFLWKKELYYNLYWFTFQISHTLVNLFYTSMILIWSKNRLAKQMKPSNANHIILLLFAIVDLHKGLVENWQNL